MEAPDSLHTERLILRRATAADAHAVFRYASDPEVTRHLPIAPRESLDQVDEFLAEVERAWEAGTGFAFAIMRRSDAETIGVIDFTGSHTGVSFGFALERAAWGHGYATEATRAVIDWAVDDDSVFRIWTTVGVDNIASRRVLEKVGMRKEGLLHRWLPTPTIGPTPSDAYMYAIWR